MNTFDVHGIVASAVADMAGSSFAMISMYLKLTFEKELPGMRWDVDITVDPKTNRPAITVTRDGRAITEHLNPLDDDMVRVLVRAVKKQLRRDL